MGLQPPWRFLGRLLLSAAALGLLLAAALPALPFPEATSWSGRAGGLLGLTALSIAGGIVFLGILRLLGGLEAEDRRRLLALNLPGRGLLERLF
jgi:hypothetical protein